MEIWKKFVNILDLNSDSWERIDYMPKWIKLGNILTDSGFAH